MNTDKTIMKIDSLLGDLSANRKSPDTPNLVLEIRMLLAEIHVQEHRGEVWNKKDSCPWCGAKEGENHV